MKSLYDLRSYALAPAAVGLMLAAFAAPAGAAVIASDASFESFPSSAAFQTFNPHDPNTPTSGERTVTTTRNLTQTFRLGAPVTIGEIDIPYARGMSGATGVLKIFEVADTLAGDITADSANTPLLNVQFTMPAGLDPAGTQRTLRLDLTGADEITLPAREGSAGYAFNLTSADGAEVFTWRFGDGSSADPDDADGWYDDGRVYYDDFIASGSTETRRDGLFALVAVPEPASLGLLGLGGLALRRRRCG